MKLFKLFLLSTALFSSLFLFNACQTDDVSEVIEEEETKDDENQEETKNTLTVTDLAVSINENLESDTTIETISATTTTGTITYTLKSTTAEGAIKIESDGAIKIDDNALIDYETRTEIKVVVTVSNGTEEKEITITVTILDVDETVEETKDITLGELDEVTITKGGTNGTYSFQYLTKDFELIEFSIQELPTVATTYNGLPSTKIVDYVETLHIAYRDKNWSVKIAESGTVKITPLGNDRYSVEITNAVYEAGEIKFLDYAITNPYSSTIKISSELHGDSSELPMISVYAEKINSTYYLIGTAKDEGFSGGSPFLKELSVSITLPAGQDLQTSNFEISSLITTDKARVAFTYKSLNPTTIKNYYLKSGTVTISRNGDKFTASFPNLPTQELKSINLVDVDNEVSLEMTGVIK